MGHSKADWSGDLPPYKTKMTEPIHAAGLGVADRLERLQRASYNVFNLASNDVAVDLLTDSGTGAMSQEQWSAMFRGDESYAGASSFARMENAFQDLTGMRFVLPAHQGRAAERSLFEGLRHVGVLDSGSIIASNAFFDTTLGWASRFARCENLYCDAFDQGHGVPAAFKGDLGSDRLQRLVAENPGRVKLVLLTVTNNSAGGQPVSLQNILEVSAFCRKNGVLVFLDACRFAENAYFIKTCESGQSERPIRDIVHDMFSHVDGATFSAKKDARTNIGGALLFSSSQERLYRACRPSIIRHEGLYTYGGMAGRDMEAIAQGLQETTEFPYLEHRVGQVAYLHDRLARLDVPVLRPPGGHAVYVDARAYLPAIPEHEYRSDTLSLLLYALGGVRSVAIGNLMYAEKDEAGRILTPAKNDFVRLALPRNVYSVEHLSYVARVFQQINRVKPLLAQGVCVSGDFRNDHFDHFDCSMKPVDPDAFERAVLSL
ncbi:tryptophanase [Candidatus Micrarchaeota archaeon]|nr:tryptophanase [Candidatus Micrarchaeota archaeon]